MKKIIGGVFTGCFVIIVLIIFLMCTKRVRTGFVGVQYTMKSGVIEETLPMGFHVVSPFIHVSEYPIALQQSYMSADYKGDSRDDESFEASTSEGKAVRIELAYMYCFDESRVVDIFKSFAGKNGETVRDTYMKPNIEGWAKEVIARFKITQLIGADRALANAELNEYLQSKLEPYGIIIKNATITDVDTDDATKAAITQKTNAQQELETAKINNQKEIEAAEKAATVAETTAKAEANAKKIAAEAEAEVKRIEAEAEAEVIRTKAEAEAEANKKVAESITEEFLEHEKINAWNGALPKVSSNDPSLIIDLAE